MDANALPRSHIIGWIAPSSASQPAKSLSKSAKKNAKRKEKREEKKANPAEEPVRDNWEDDEEEDEHDVPKAPTADENAPPSSDVTKTGVSSEHTADKPNGTTIVSSKAIQELTADLEKLNTK